MKTTGTRKLTMKKLAKTKRTKLHKTVFSNAPMDIYERMHHAFGNEEIFWEWFWEVRLNGRFEFITLTRMQPSGVIMHTFSWVDSLSGGDFWSSIFTAFQKEELLCRQ